MKTCANCQHRRCRPSNEQYIERMLVWKCDISKKKVANTSEELPTPRAISSKHFRLERGLLGDAG